MQLSLLLSLTLKPLEVEGLALLHQISANIGGRAAIIAHHEDHSSELAPSYAGIVADSCKIQPRDFEKDMADTANSDRIKFVRFNLLRRRSANM